MQKMRSIEGDGAMATSMMTPAETSPIAAAMAAPTQTGTDAPDTLLGDAGKDFLVGLADSDKLFGFAGDDTLSGGRDDDRLVGAEGNDKLYGGNGSDRLVGGLGNDLLMGGLGDDALIGGGGVDTASYAGTASPTGVRASLQSGRAEGAYDGDDLFSIENLIGSAGGDKLGGSDFGNLIRGVAGADSIYGGRGDDTLSGGAGSDTLIGGSNDDRLYGGGSDDTVTGGYGVDRMRGGQGADQFLFTAAESRSATDRILDFEVGIDKIALGPAIGAGDVPVVVLDVLANGNTLVQVGDADELFLQVEVTAVGGTLNDSDVIFL
jgi:Ca2+-binding RTX toxin-like protein